MEYTRLPTGDAFTAEQVGKDFQLIESTPFDNSELSYKMLVPKGWKIDPVQSDNPQLSSREPKPLNLFTEPGNHAFLIVQAIRLSHEITAANWLRFNMIMRGQTVKIIEAPSAFVADCLVTQKIDDIAFVTRIMGGIQGNTLFFVSASTPEANYSKYAEALGLCVVSFRPKTPPKQKTIEEHKSFSLNQVLHFVYPASWTTRIVKDPPKGKKVVDLYWEEKSDHHLNGLIRVKGVATNLGLDSGTLVQDSRDEFAELGLSIGSLIENIDLKPARHFVNGISQAYEAIMTSTGVRQELWITIVERPNYKVVLVLLTPDRRDHFALWAVNHRAYEIIFQSLH